MSVQSSDSKGCASWFKWFVGVAIALLAAGSGIVALLSYNENRRQQEQQLYQQETQQANEQYQQELEQYQRDLEAWNNFSPPSLSGAPIEFTLRGGIDNLDLETGLAVGIRQGDRQWDLLFGGGPAPEYAEFLRALDGVAWYERGMADFESIKYREIRDADYEIRKHPTSGYNDLFNIAKGNVPVPGYIFFVKTPEGNVAIVQITGYETVDPNPLVVRNLRIKYEVFPIVYDPPKPVPPS